MPDLKTKLRHLLERVGPENIWRPIVDKDGSLLVDGHEDMRDGSPDDLARVDFSGKHVLDLGCNYGYYSFLVKRLGAESVVGVDIDAEAIAGCRLLADLYGFTNVEFLISDIINIPLATKFDCAMLVNFIGKRSVCKGIVPILETLRRHSQGEILLTTRIKYNISHNLEASPKQLCEIYGEKYIRAGNLYLVEFIQDFFQDTMVMSFISPDYQDKTLKRTLLFTPSSGSSY